MSILVYSEKCLYQYAYEHNLSMAVKCQGSGIWQDMTDAYA